MGGLLAFITTIFFFATALSLIKPNLILRNETSRKKPLLIFGGLTILFFIITGIASPEMVKTKSDTINQPQIQNSSPSPTNQPSPTPLNALDYNFTILKNEKQGTTRKMTIFTTEKDDQRLIQVNNGLVKAYKENLTHLSIDYFDDENIAQDYFKKIVDPSISDKEKDRLFSHYIAGFTYNSVTGYKKLEKHGKTVDEPFTILKEY